MITREKARRLRAIIEDAVEAYGLDDAAALEVVELFPAWQAGKEYAIGERVQHEGKLYECVNAHTASNEWTPPSAACSQSPGSSFSRGPRAAASRRRSPAF